MSSQVLVRVPPGYRPERTYVCEQLFGRMLGLDVQVESDDSLTATTVSVSDSERQLFLEDGLFSSPPEHWLTPDSIPSLPLSRWMTGPKIEGLAGGIPVLFGATLPGGGFVEDSDDGITCGVDLLGGAFFLLSGYEEIATSQQDEHGRFLGAMSILEPGGLIEVPLTDVYVAALWDLMVRLWPGLRKRSPPYRLRLTCDVDHAFGIHGRTARQILRRASSDLLRRRSPAMAVRRLSAWPQVAAGNLSRDPNNTLDFIMSTAEAQGLTATFYFPAGLSSHELDALHSPTYPPLVGHLREIGRRGHTIGLHPSYASAGAAVDVRRELEVLERACDVAGVDQARFGGRQHYLRWGPRLWRVYEEVGLVDDSSMGFPDRPGFRAGTAAEFQAFDLAGRRMLDVVERPLHLMDVTLLGYQGLDEQALAERAERLAQTVGRLGGTMTLLWHNDQLVSARQRRYFQAAVEAAA